MPGQRPHSSQPWDDLDIFEPEPRRPERRKPIVRVVCPVCAVIVSVNAVEVEEVTETLCSKCEDTTISVSTDDFGRIVKIEGWSNVVAEKKVKKAEWKEIAPYAIAAVIVLLLFLILFRQAGPVSSTPTAPAAAVKPATAAITAAQSELDTEADLSKPVTPTPGTPTKDRLPFSDVLETPNNGREKRANPPTRDMFAPEKN